MIVLPILARQNCLTKLLMGPNLVAHTQPLVHLHTSFQMWLVIHQVDHQKLQRLELHLVIDFFSCLYFFVFVFFIIL
jgi:hypothetical protein